MRVLGGESTSYRGMPGPSRDIPSRPGNTPLALANAELHDFGHATARSDKIAHMPGTRSAISALSSTRRGTEVAIVRQISKAAVYGMLTLRWGTVAQMAAAATGGAAGRARRPVVSAGGMVVYMVATAAISRALLRAGRPDRRTVAAGDVALMSALLAIQHAYAPPATGVSTWDAWGYGASVPTAVLLGVAADSDREVLAGMGALIGSYAVGIKPAVQATGGWHTVAANSAGILVGSLAAHHVWKRALVVAAKADRATEFERALAAEHEARQRDRQEFDAALADRDAKVRAHLHGVANELGREGKELVADGFEPQGALLLALSQKVHLDLGARGDIKTLGGALQAGAAAGRVHVSLVVTDAARDLELPPAVLERVTVAVRSFVSNTEQHSGVLEATLLAEVVDGRWMVRLFDNGRGFDPDSTAANNGLRDELGSALRYVGVDVSVDSKPGTGVRVVLSGPVGGDQP